MLYYVLELRGAIATLNLTKIIGYNIWGEPLWDQLTYRLTQRLTHAILYIRIYDIAKRLDSRKSKCLYFQKACYVMVFLSPAFQFSLSTLSLAKKTKADRLVVLCKSVASGHGRVKARQRLGEKLEFIDWDPLIERAVLYREDKKVRSIRDKNIVQISRLRYTNNIHNKWPTLCPNPSEQ